MHRSRRGSRLPPPPEEGRPRAALLRLRLLVGPDYFTAGAATSSACGAPLASLTEATSQPRAGVFACWLLSIESGSEAEPPAAIAIGLPVTGLMFAPLETAGWNGSNDATLVVSTIPPGTSENAFTVYLNALGLAAFCVRPISLAIAGS